MRSGLPKEMKKAPIPSIEKAMTHPEVKAKLEKIDFAVDYKSPADQNKLAKIEHEVQRTIFKKR